MTLIGCSQDAPERSQDIPRRSQNTAGRSQDALERSQHGMHVDMLMPAHLHAHTYALTHVRIRMQITL